MTSKSSYRHRILTRHRFDICEIPLIDLVMIRKPHLITQLSLSAFVLLAGTLAAQPYEIDYYFSPVGAGSNTILSEIEFDNDNFGIWYEDNTPTGGARFDYEEGLALLFDNNGSTFEETQTSLYFQLGSNNGGILSDGDFTAESIIELPASWSNLPVNSRIEVGMTFFYGPVGNEYSNEFVASLGYANFPGIAVGRFFLYGEDTDGPPENLQPTTADFARITYSFNSDSGILTLSLTELTRSGNNLTAGQTYSTTFNIPGTTFVFVPSLKFDTENVSVSSSGSDKPRVHSIIVTGDNLTPQSPPCLIPGSTEAGDNYCISPWLGEYSNFAPFIYSFDHGFLFLIQDGSSYFFYDNQLGWLWTQPQTYPFLYSFQNENYLYYSGNAGGLRFFWDFGIGDFIDAPLS